MKNLKEFRDLKELDIDELKKRREETLSELLNIRTRFAMKHLDNPMKISKLKHSVARINTLLKEYELGIREIPA